MGNKLKNQVHRNYSGFPIESDSGYRVKKQLPGNEGDLSEIEQEQLSNEGPEVHAENNYVDTKNP
ncbi:MAG TPA: hypothetical protein VEC37_12010 [Bacillota bacterium]|nr:hypothetical protein [Bacillota bacterium]